MFEALKELIAVISGISWAGAIAILGGLITLALTFLQLVYFGRDRSSKTNHHADLSKLRDDITDDLKENRDEFTKNIENVRQEIRVLDKEISDLQGLVEGRMEIQYDSVIQQVSDLKHHQARLREKMEKLTDIIIEHFTREQDA